jgi:Pretoxin HINT domain
MQAIQLENEHASYQATIADAASECKTVRAASGPGGGFVAGTWVHTDRGLVPIEKIRVGDRVLSQPEMKGELAYRKVLNTFVHEDNEIFLVESRVTNTPFKSREEFDYEAFWDEEDNLPPRYLVATGSHPFWVQGVGWTRAELLSDRVVGTHVLETKDGLSAVVVSVRRICVTAVDGIGWPEERNEDLAPTIDLRHESVVVGTENVGNDFILSSSERYDHRFIRRRVYNFEVEEFRTYYVGEEGVWVHHARGDQAGDVESV